MWSQKTMFLCIFAVIRPTSCYSHHHHCHHDHDHSESHHNHNHRKLEEVFSWKQLDYDFNGHLYSNDTHFPHSTQSETSAQEPADKDKFFIQYNNIPIGLEVYRDTVFVTVPRRRYGIPSTLNIITIPSSSSAPLMPYPGSEDLVSVYRPRVDGCGRLWMVDTGLLEVPGNREQVRPPSIIVYDLATKKRILKYELKASDLIDERTPGGLTSISVETSISACEDAFAYITDLATEGLIVYSWRLQDSWRFQHESLRHDSRALNFSVAGYTIPWKDGLFSIALSNPDHSGKRVAFYHALASTQEYAVDTECLKTKGCDLGSYIKLLGNRGPSTQSGSHAYHGATKTLLFANVARDAILCWRVTDKMAPENVAVVAQDSEKLLYISDLKIVGDDVWVLANKIPVFVYSALKINEQNFYIHKRSSECVDTIVTVKVKVKVKYIQH